MMKHYIIVKFKEGFEYKRYTADILSIFGKTLDIDGITDVSIKTSNSDRQNRYDIMIEITMEKEALKLYDVSAPHICWKKKYGEFIDKKTIFDCD